MTNGSAGPETPDPLFSLFFFVLLLSCFFFLFVFLCCFVSVRSVHQAIHAELDSLRIEREAYNMRVGKDKRRLYTLHRPTRELREREREGRQDTFGRDYITSG